MIFPAIDIIQRELNKVLNPAASAETGNIGEILASNSHLSGKDIIISLVNIEENRISRDAKNFVKTDTGIICQES